MYNSIIDRSNMYESIYHNFQNMFNIHLIFLIKIHQLIRIFMTNIDNILILGMGGSAITGLLFKEILVEQTFHTCKCKSRI